jgi:integrase/recombinase XerD
MATSAPYPVILEREATGALRGARIGLPVVDDYLRYLMAVGRAPTTCASYAYDLALFCRWLAAHTSALSIDAALRALAPAQLLAFVEHLAAARPGRRPLAPATIARRLVAVARFFDWAETTGIVARTPVPWARPWGPGDHQRAGRSLRPPAGPRVPLRLPRPSPADEVAAFVASLRTWRDRALVALLVGAGLRLSEALGLRLGDLEWGGQQVFVRRGKGGRPRSAMAPITAWMALKAYLDSARPASPEADTAPAAPVFVVLHGPHRGQPLTAAGVQTLVRHHRRLAGTPNVTPHRLRHTCGTDLHRAGLALEFLQEQLGHRHLESTRCSVYLSNERLRAAYLAVQPHLYGEAPATEGQ